MCLGCQKTNVSTKLRKKSECNHLYTELASLDLQILDLFKVTKDANLIETNKTLRTWISNLSNECPPIEDLKIIREYIEYEYPKHFTV